MKEFVFKAKNLFSQKQFLLTAILILSILVAFNLGFIIGSKIFSEAEILINCP